MSNQILIIDDDLEYAASLIDAITKYNNAARCRCAISAMQAIEILKDVTQPLPKLIFFSYNIPSINRNSFLQILKSEESLNKVPLVVFTKTDWERDLKEVINLGAKYLLTKPTKPASMEYMVHTLMSSLIKEEKDNISNTG